MYDVNGDNVLMTPVLMCLAWPATLGRQIEDDDPSFQLDVCAVNAHRRSISRALLCPDGKTVMTASEDGRLRGWGSAALEPLFSVTVVPTPSTSAQAVRHGRPDCLTDIAVMPLSNR